MVNWRVEKNCGAYWSQNQVEDVAKCLKNMVAASRIPTDGKIKELAVEVTGSQSGAVAGAKAAYSLAPFGSNRKVRIRQDRKSYLVRIC